MEKVSGVKVGNWARDKISANYRMNLKPARVIHSENADNIRKLVISECVELQLHFIAILILARARYQVIIIF